MLGWCGVCSLMVSPRTSRTSIAAAVTTYNTMMETAVITWEAAHPRYLLALPPLPLPPPPDLCQAGVGPLPATMQLASDRRLRRGEVAAVQLLASQRRSFPASRWRSFPASQRSGGVASWWRSVAAWRRRRSAAVCSKRHIRPQRTSCSRSVRRTRPLRTSVGAPAYEGGSAVSISSRWRRLGR